MGNNVDNDSSRLPGSTNSTGVPQGSIQRPFLYWVYIYDLASLVEHVEHEVVLFADGISLWVKLKDINILWRCEQSYI